MADNILFGQNVVHAKQTVSIASTGINSTNVSIIYLINAESNPSFVPGRTINPITQFVEGKSYIVKALVPMDLTEYLMPPFPVGDGILLEDGGSIIVE